MYAPKYRPCLLVLSTLTLAITAPTFAADVDININVPGLYQPARPVYQQARPAYIQPQPVIVQSQPAHMQRYDDSEWRCKNDKCKWKKEKKHKHHKHDHDN